MAHRICPWWLGYFLVSPLRRWIHHPVKILSPFVRPGMTVLELGPGMGFFTLDLAAMVGPTGRIIAVDIQPKMLEGLQRRARRANLLDRIEIRQAQSDRMGVDGLEGLVDFVLAFATLHELPDPGGFFHESNRLLRTGGKLLLVEPRGHVKQKDFQLTLEVAERKGLRVETQPAIPRSWTAVLVKAGL